MTKEQVAQARRLADDMAMEPSHQGMNRAGEIMSRLLDEREALLEACRVAASDHANSWQTKEAAQAAIAKAEAP